MYRSGWSYKDPNRSRILAITMTLTGYLTLLRNAVPNSGSDISGNRAIRFQWDPERNVKLAKLPYRSLQLGISEDWVERWIDEWIVGIQDITEDVRRWKAYIDADQKTGSRRVRREVAARWTEEVVEVDEEIEERLGMRDTTA
ncbi:hypothetical protein FRC17_004994 [Serendipita sp. 399]|nr:hypothetical protein FRC17_004994 [Serendipita sp. 399]